MKRLAVYVSLAALACSLLVAGSTPAAAALTYCADPGNYHDGFRKSLDSTYTTWGVSAQVRVQSSSLCSSGDTSQQNFSTAWTMISSHLGGGWGQTGFIRWYNHITVHFAQYKQGSCCMAQTKYGTTHIYADELHQYWTLRTSSPNCPNTSQCLVLHVNQTTWYYTPFDTVSANWSTPYIQAYEGETGYDESDVPGVSTAKTGYNYMQYVNGNNTWVAQGCGMEAINQGMAGRWDQETIACDHRRIWTAVP